MCLSTLRLTENHTRQRRWNCWRGVEQGVETACIAWHSVSNLYYIVAPTRGGVSTRDFIVELTRFVEVATTGTEGIRYAAGLSMADFEDAMQVAAARACGARCIVTRNVRDYTRSPIRAISPQEALAELTHDE